MMMIPSVVTMTVNGKTEQQMMMRGGGVGGGDSSAQPEPRSAGGSPVSAAGGETAVASSSQQRSSIVQVTPDWQQHTALTSPWPHCDTWSSLTRRRPWASRTPTTSRTTWRRTRKVRWWDNQHLSALSLRWCSRLLSLWLKAWENIKSCLCSFEIESQLFTMELL